MRRASHPVFKIARVSSLVLERACPQPQRSQDPATSAPYPQLRTIIGQQLLAAEPVFCTEMAGPSPSPDAARWELIAERPGTTIEKGRAAFTEQLGHHCVRPPAGALMRAGPFRPGLAWAVVSVSRTSRWCREQGRLPPRRQLPSSAAAQHDVLLLQSPAAAKVNAPDRSRLVRAPWSVAAAAVCVGRLDRLVESWLNFAHALTGWTLESGPDLNGYRVFL